MDRMSITSLYNIYFKLFTKSQILLKKPYLIIQVDIWPICSRSFQIKLLALALLVLTLLILVVAAILDLLPVDTLDNAD